MIILKQPARSKSLLRQEVRFARRVRKATDLIFQQKIHFRWIRE